MGIDPQKEWKSLPSRDFNNTLFQHAFKFNQSGKLRGEGSITILDAFEGKAHLKQGIFRGSWSISGSQLSKEAEKIIFFS